jgi:hypothetical protein
MIQLSETQKQTIINTIKSSSTFKNAPTSIALLQYLHEATLKNTSVKEGLIDIEFFGNKESSDTSNPRVRVNVYNLRKKLVSYYNEEGIQDDWRISIDKGQYQLRFFKKTIESNRFKKTNWKIATPYLVVAVCILALVISNLPKNPPKFWQSFVNEKTNTHLYIGDHFGVVGITSTNGFGWTRDFKINNASEFYSFIDKNPDLKNKLQPANYSYTTKMAVLATNYFTKIFQSFDQNLPIRFSTEITISEIKEGNAIYAGPIKNNNLFVDLFNDANANFKIKNNHLYFSKHANRKDTVFELTTKDTRQEYAIVSKYPSIGGTEQVVFFSDHDIGVSATADYFTNLDSIEKFEKTHLNNKKYFTALYKVKGKNRTDTHLKLQMVIPF